ncbi:MAG: hypothetical protein K2P38_18385 [Lachnospiraceae bacterium]|nr:hypothetical protein [Lachnospiraceae bacterium]
MVKYVLIVSQYYHSYVQKICEVQDDFVVKAREMIEELEDYKRSSFEKEKPVYYGDLDKRYNVRTNRVLEKGGRINLNDAGDIYFELSDSIDYLIDEVIGYGKRSEECYKTNRGSKRIMDEVSKHHARSVVTDIIRRHFVVI